MDDRAASQRLADVNGTATNGGRANIRHAQEKCNVWPWIISSPAGAACRLGPCNGEAGVRGQMTLSQSAGTRAPPPFILAAFHPVRRTPGFRPLYLVFCCEHTTPFPDRNAPTTRPLIYPSARPVATGGRCIPCLQHTPVQLRSSVTALRRLSPQRGDALPFERASPHCTCLLTYYFTSIILLMSVNSPAVNR
jgi:hypothetical protein